MASPVSGPYSNTELTTTLTLLTWVFRDPDVGPHTWAIGILLTDPSPHPHPPPAHISQFKMNSLVAFSTPEYSATIISTWSQNMLLTLQ